MPNSWTSLRRRLGALFLLLAGCMLVLGFTWAEPWLRGGVFVLYWLTCFVFTGLAMLMALIDVRSIRKSARREQQELLGRVSPDPDLGSGQEDR